MTYYLDDRDCIDGQIAEACRIVRNEKRREYIARNRDRINAYQRMYAKRIYEENKEKILAYQREWKRKWRARA